jgi:NAD(P)-dependent dehydrogenase (short-subunit alcohol dehydrogenase family)
MTNRTWFISGASGGFGRAFSRAALTRGDRVAGTSRDISRLGDLVAEFGEAFLPLQLDIVDRAAGFEAVRRAHEHLGRLDIIVNSAGYGQHGVVEELTEEEARRQLDTNFFGPMWITQAALPFLRQQGGGHIVQVSSWGGHFSASSMGIYCSSKWALEAISQALASEVTEFGIRVTLVEPGAFDTSAESSASYPSQPLEAYVAAHEDLQQRLESFHGPAAAMTLGDPKAAADALLAIVDADDPPLRVLFGSGGLALIEGEYEERFAQWRASTRYSDMSATPTAGASTQSQSEDT